jgi:hypothetical protein
MLRVGIIAIVVSAMLARFWGGLARWLIATLLVLGLRSGATGWEVWFLNWLRPVLSITRGVHVALVSESGELLCDHFFRMGEWLIRQMPAHGVAANSGQQ